MQQKILFILKKNEIYGSSLIYTKRSAGLYNSTRFIVESMREKGIDAHIVEVKDNNDIDREVTKHRPDFVVIEALWVVPEKFPVLMSLHPNVEWFIHLHSDMPFLSVEGNAIDWIIKCAGLGVGILANSCESFDALFPIVPEGMLFYLPNIYLSNPHPPVSHNKVSHHAG